MKPAHIAFAAILLCCTPAIAQDDPAPAAETDTAIESSDEPNAEQGGSAKEEPRPAPVQKDAPFKELAGRWVGEGRIGMSEGKVESVKCRATYFVEGAGKELRQNIRCASSGGKVEVKSNVIANQGRLTGTWNELVYNLGGDLKGEVTQRGFRISVKGGDLTANMDVIVMNDRQIVEIQFFNSSLRGLTLILKKG
ncbi:exported protein of unknown function [Hyphomicrobium sp. 1Nfss2.1]|uniref:hypothetical protein n=1 Tax=Hyphomicrobium sp. 1Nfss2.1 TaxID=3413936 RepID=UPI003C79AAAD